MWRVLLDIGLGIAFLIAAGLACRYWSEWKWTLEHAYPLPRGLEPILARAGQLIEGQQPRDEDGENKRHQVYARLIKDFSDSRRRDLALAIELVMQKR